MAAASFKPGPQIGNGNWILGQVTLDHAGRVISHSGGLDIGLLVSRCPGLIPPPPAIPSLSNVEACVAKLGIHTVTTYQPASRFWAFQGIESAIFVALAAVLLATAAWAVRRRIA